MMSRRPLRQPRAHQAPPSTATTAGREREDDHAIPLPWWCSPSGIATGFLLPLTVLISYAGDLPHPALTIRGVKALDQNYLLLGGVMILTLGLAGWLGAQLHTRTAARPRSKAPRQHRSAELAAWDRAAVLIGSIATLAFCVWFRDFLLSPALLWSVLSGAYTPDRTTIELTPGLTSLANTTPVFFSIYAYRLYADRGDRHADGSAVHPIPGLLHGMCTALVLLTVFRVYVWSERLAMIEMLVPFSLTAGRWAVAQKSWTWAVLRQVGPYAAIPLVIVFFGVAEYARSWSVGTYQDEMNFWEFALGRFASYYYTSLNNGASLLKNTAWPTWEFEYTLEWVHRAPFGLGKLFSQAVGYQGSRFDLFLSTYQDAEFNSPSGIYAILADLGLTGGLMYMIAVGVLSGLCLRAYREGRLVGVLFYPMFFISFMEIYRYPYLGTSRAFTWSVGIGLASLVALAKQPTARQRAPQSAAQPLRPSRRPTTTIHHQEA